MHVGGVSESQVFAQLLLDGDARSGVTQGTKITWIYLHGSSAKQSLHTTAHRGVECAAEQRIRCRIRRELLLLLGIKPLLILRSSQGKQSHNVRLGQRRTTAVANG